MKCSECKYVVIKKVCDSKKLDCFCHRFPEKVLVAGDHFCGEHKK
ncbi:hypothetical protein LCGC14_1099390 [marine sediment metagenome]|uniref:Uncharacterized protein n=1 Tax=marine sediment metagenome TaxID=412755 RepID=A0A0F9QG37_9ZZZZ